MFQRTSLTKNSKRIVSNSVNQKEILPKKTYNLSQRYAIAYEDDFYPKRLKETYNPPSVLYSSKKFNLNQQGLLAIVGTREASLYGLARVRELVAALKKYQVTIVSGLAYGIDIAAHRAALEQNIPTIAVIAGGLDMIYPYEHAREAGNINKKGCIITEHPLGTKPQKYHFPIRNRIIAGMVDAVIVIEAGQKSGALITAAYANEHNTEVFAFPGSVENPKTAGCHHLIKTHQAHIMTTAEDIAYIMDWKVPKSSKDDDNKIPDLGVEARTIVDILKSKKPLNAEEISQEMQQNITYITAILLQLEIKNLVTPVGGNRYILNY